MSWRDLSVGHVVALALIVTALLGVLALPTPYMGDQADFAYGAKVIRDGGVYYRDFWDNKQPGIYLFFLVGGTLFGFSETGVHLLEWLWQLVCAAALTWLALKCVSRPRIAALASISTIGLYFAVVTRWQMTKVEPLIALPVVLMVVFAYKLLRSPKPHFWGLAFGLSVGVLILFKILYAPLSLGIAAVTVVHLYRGGFGDPSRKTLHLGAGALVGALMVVTPVVIYYASRGALHDLIWVTFGYPVEALGEVDVAPLSRLFASGKWLLGVSGAFLPFAFLGLISLRKAREPFIAGCFAVYGAMLIPLVLIQKFSWWEYHFLLFLIPIGFFSVLGLDRLQSILSTTAVARLDRILVGAAFLALPLLTILLGVTRKSVLLIRALANPIEAPVSVKIDDQYLTYWFETDFLRSGEPPNDDGEIYVFGDPRILWLSGRRQAIPPSGTGWEMYTDSQWRNLPVDLRRELPSFVYVGDEYADLILRRSPATARLLETFYRSSSSNRALLGTWFERSELLPEE